MKKVTAIVMAAVLSAGLFAGCAQPTSTTPSASPSGSPSANAGSDNSWEYIKSKGEMIVGLDATFAPMGFTNEKGEIIGYDIDLANAVGEKLGVKVKFQPIDWDAKEMELNGKKIDVVWNGMSTTPARQEKMALTKPYLNNSIVILTMKDKAIQTKADLVGKKVAVQAESSGLEVLEADDIFAQVKDKLTQYKSYDEAIMDLEIGRVDAIVIDKALAQYKMTQKKDTYVICPENFGNDFYVIGLRKDDKAFLEKLQGALDELIKEGKASEISMKWFGDDVTIR